VAKSNIPIYIVHTDFSGQNLSTVKCVSSQFDFCITAYSKDRVFSNIGALNFDLFVFHINEWNEYDYFFIKNLRDLYPNLLTILSYQNLEKKEIVRFVNLGINGVIKYPYSEVNIRNILEDQAARVVEMRQTRELINANQILIRFKLLNCPELITDCANYIKHLAKSMNLYRGNNLGNFFVTVHEGLANAYEHGNHKDPHKFILFDVKIENDQIELQITDEGQGFDFRGDQVGKLPQDINHPSGRGIYLMNLFMDKIKFFHRGRQLVVSKKLDDLPIASEMKS